jgi:hypothetical protein
MQFCHSRNDASQAQGARDNGNPWSLRQPPCPATPFIPRLPLVGGDRDRGQCSSLSWATSQETISALGTRKVQWLPSLGLKLVDGVPSYDSFNHLVTVLDRRALGDCFHGRICPACDAVGVRHVPTDRNAVRVHWVGDVASSACAGPAPRVGFLCSMQTSFGRPFPVGPKTDRRGGAFSTPSRRATVDSSRSPVTRPFLLLLSGRRHDG